MTALNILAMPKEAKRPCCCCGDLVSARTEQRHIRGDAPPRVKAAQAQKSGSGSLLKSLAAAPSAIRKYFSPKKSKASSSLVTSQSAPAPDQSVNPPVVENQAAVGEDTAMNDMGENIDTNMADPFNESQSNLDDDHDVQKILADIVASAEQGTWGGPRLRRATVESDEEDDARSTLSMETDSSFISDWDQKSDSLTIDELIDEDFERELADFGMFHLKLCHGLALTYFFIKWKNCLKMILTLYVCSRSKLKSISPTKHSINSNTPSLVPTSTP